MNVNFIFLEKSRKIKTEIKIYIHVLREFIAMNGFNMKMKSWPKNQDQIV